MNSGEPRMLDGERSMPMTIPNVPTWRYLGDRTAADLAYCARFGVQEAPEPTESLNGVWSYALPTAVLRR